jgi:hypothetical protein
MDEGEESLYELRLVCKICCIFGLPKFFRNIEYEENDCHDVLVRSGFGSSGTDADGRYLGEDASRD